MKKYISTKFVEACFIPGMDGGAYKVRSPDGTCVLIPSGEFQRTFTTVVAMPFSEALQALTNGERVARQGWKDSWIQLLHPYAPHPDALAGKTTGVYTNPYFKAADNNEHAVGTMSTYIAKKTEGNCLEPWAPAHMDLLATDWGIVLTAGAQDTDDGYSSTQSEQGYT